MLSLCWQSSFLVRDLCVPCISISYFLLLFPVLSLFFSVSPLVSMPWSVFPVFPPVVSESHVLHEGLWSILNRFFCSMREVDATSFSYIGISGFLTQVCWRALVPWVFWHLWWIFTDFGCMGLLVCPLFVPLVSTSGPLQSHSAFVAVALWCVTSDEALMPQALCFLLKLLNIWISCASIPAGASPLPALWRRLLAFWRHNR